MRCHSGDQKLYVSTESSATCQKRQQLPPRILLIFKVWVISELRMMDLDLNPEIDDNFFICKVSVIMLSHRIVNG